MQTFTQTRRITNTINIVADTFVRQNVAAFQAYHNDEQDLNAFRQDEDQVE